MHEGRSFLLNLLREEQEEEKINRLRGRSENEWQALLEIAEQHIMTPLLFQRLRPYFPGPHIPDHYQALMRRSYFQLAAFNMRLYHQLEELMQKFSDAAVPVILLKGAHLAMFVYGNISIRPMEDIDLLVKEVDFKKAHSLLIESGYSSSGEIAWPNNLPTYFQTGKVHIDMHSKLKGLPLPGRFDINELWARAEKVTLGATEALTLCPEDLLLHVCLHTGIQHGFENGLISCIDTGYILKHYEGRLDWEQLWSRAREWGIDRAVYLMLALTAKISGLPLPEQAKAFAPAYNHCQEALAEAEKLIFELQLDVADHVATLFKHQSFQKKLGLLSQRITTPANINSNGRQEKPVKASFKRFCSYLSRSRLLFERHGKTIWRGLLRDPQTTAAIKAQNRRNNLREWLRGAEER